MAQRHLSGEEVTPGFEVNTISRDDYQQRTEELVTAGSDDTAKPGLPRRVAAY